MIRLRISLVALLVACLATCAIATNMPLKPGEGFVDVPGGKIWYRIVGSGTATPLLLLHGGPAAPSNYLKPLAALANDRPVIFFDQLGCGRSACKDDSTQWTIQNFVMEIPALRKALGLEKIHLYGHSWGTILATDYLLTNPSGVESVILAGPALSIPLWTKGTDSLLKTLPDSLQAIIHKAEASKSFDSPEYQGAMMTFYGMYVGRKQPWSADTDSSFGGINAAIYNYMQGPSEFTITGTLRTYDRTKQLGKLKLPTLVVVGQYDESVPSNARYFSSLIPGSKFEIIPNAAHLAMQDDSAKYIQVIRDFINGVEKKK